MTDTFDDLAKDTTPSAYHGLSYSSAFWVRPGNFSFYDRPGSFAVSPPNVLFMSAMAGDPRFGDEPGGTIAVTNGYAYFNELYYGCINLSGAVACNISVTGYDADGVPVPEVILPYLPIASTTLSLAVTWPVKGPPIKYANATIRVVGSADAAWVTSMLLDSLSHVDCVGE
ncbi:hypothetical protein LTR53_013241 [Teratosphaeriaceae sp. CCFEE 6253]|nr:hypothetical protein LTR53_013241 [Teratosphaeriaceae sp. CCFEE 6253]